MNKLRNRRLMSHKLERVYLYKVLTVLLLLSTSLVEGASIDCSKASNNIEQYICEIDSISAMDEALSEIYWGLSGELIPAQKNTLKSEQLDWLTKRNTQCAQHGDMISCLQGAYRDRIDDLSSQSFATKCSSDFKHPDIPSYVEIKAPYGADIQSKQRDLLILDLDGDGLELKSQSIHFDLNADGFSTLTDFPKPDDAILFIDLNSDCLPNNGQEILGGESTENIGNEVSSAFQFLSKFDDNQDGNIDVDDTIFVHIRSWQDLDENGYPELGEIHTLAGINVKSINIGGVTSGANLANSYVFQTSHYLTWQDEQRTTGSVYLKTNHWDSYLNVDVHIPPEVQKLPQFNGGGKIPNFHEAIVLDTSNRLRQAVEKYISDPKNIGDVKELNKILYLWAGIYDDDLDVQGKKVRFMEKIAGRASHPLGINNLEKQIDGYLKFVEKKLILRGMFADFFDDRVVELPDYIWKKDAFDVHFQHYFEQKAKKNYRSAVIEQNTLLNHDAIKGLLPFYFNVTLLDERKIIRDSGLSSNLEGGPKADSIDARGGADIINAFGGNDTIYGRSGNDIIDDGFGNDTVYGNEGDDTFHAAPGNDIFYGGAGSDTYIFGNGDCRDRIFDDEGSLDQIIFTDGLDFGRAVIDRVDDHLRIRFKRIATEVIVENFFSNSNSIEQFVFSDGQVLTEQGIKKRIRTEQIVAAIAMCLMWFGLAAIFLRMIVKEITNKEKN